MSSANINIVAEGIKKQLEKDVGIVMMREVASAVKDEHQEAIDDVVYSQYTPRYYKRRMQGEGLKDRRNMRINRKGNIGIRFTNITRGNPRYGGDQRMRIAESIEQGTGLMKTIGPRKFFAETTKRLKRNGTHVSALRSGLEKMGYKTYKRTPKLVLKSGFGEIEE